MTCAGLKVKPLENRIRLVPPRFGQSGTRALCVDNPGSAQKIKRTKNTSRPGITVGVRSHGEEVALLKAPDQFQYFVRIRRCSYLVFRIVGSMPASLCDIFAVLLIG